MTSFYSSYCYALAAILLTPFLTHVH